MGHHMAILGHGGIRRYMTIALVIELAALGLGALAVLWQGLPAWTVLAYTLVGQCWAGCLVLHAAWRSQGIRFRSWISHTVAPIGLVVVPAVGAALGISHVMSEGLSRLIAVGVDPCGENGEYHTFVTNSPGFAAPVPIQSGEVVQVRGYWAVDLALAATR